MTDHITRLKEALEAGPTPGPWTADVPDGYWAREAGILAPQWGCIAQIGIDKSSPHWDGPQRANAAFIAAANPAAIRELLAERQSLLERLEQAEKDARRYRWLRTQSHDWGVCEWDNSSSEWVRDARGATVIDAAIDAAIASQEAPPADGGGQSGGKTASVATKCLSGNDSSVVDGGAGQAAIAAQEGGK